MSNKIIRPIGVNGEMEEYITQMVARNLPPKKKRKAFSAGEWKCTHSQQRTKIDHALKRGKKVVEN